MRIITVTIVSLVAQILLAPSSAAAQPCSTMRYGWTHTFGSDQTDVGFSVAAGANGEVYFGGEFEGRIDFNPSPKKSQWHESNGETDSFYCFFDADGKWQWSGAVGGLSRDICYAVHATEDRLFLSGTFFGTVDLNPGKKEDFHSSVGTAVSNTYLTSMGIDRRYHWTRMIPCDHSSQLRGEIATDSSGNVIAVGYWHGNADFNPGKREDLRSSHSPYSDALVWKLDSKGKYQWAHTFGGSDRDDVWGIAVDDLDNIYASGVWSTEVDFDPRGKHDVRKVEGVFWDVFLTKLSPKGKVEWTWTVGSTTEDESRSVAIGPDGRIYIAGFVTGTADFDARGNGDVREPQGAADGFLTLFTPSGSYLGTHILPGVNGQGMVNPWTMDIDALRGLIAIGGSYSGTVDFDPGPGQELRTSKGSWDCFAVLLTLDGEFVDAITFGGSDNQEWLWGLDFDNNGNLLLTGWFSSATVDFNACEGGDVRARVGDRSSDIFLTKYIRLTQ